MLVPNPSLYLTCWCIWLASSAALVLLCFCAWHLALRCAHIAAGTLRSVPRSARLFCYLLALPICTPTPFFTCWYGCLPLATTLAPFVFLRLASSFSCTHFATVPYTSVPRLACFYLPTCAAFAQFTSLTYLLVHLASHPHNTYLFGSSVSNIAWPCTQIAAGTHTWCLALLTSSAAFLLSHYCPCGTCPFVLCCLLLFLGLPLCSYLNLYCVLILPAP